MSYIDQQLRRNEAVRQSRGLNSGASVNKRLTEAAKGAGRSRLALLSCSSPGERGQTFVSWYQRVTRYGLIWRRRQNSSIQPQRGSQRRAVSCQHSWQLKAGCTPDSGGQNVMDTEHLSGPIVYIVQVVLSPSLLSLPPIKQNLGAVFGAL